MIFVTGTLLVLSGLCELLTLATKEKYDFLVKLNICLFYLAISSAIILVILITYDMIAIAINHWE